MTAAPAGYSRKTTTTTAAAPPAGYSKRVEEPTSGAPPSIWQQLFDVKNAKTGESYLYGNTPAPTQFEDIQRTGRDTLTRGYYDKYLGPEEQAKTERARERMPDWVELPVDVGASVVGSPYRAAGAGWGAVAGGLEGAANAFGHQRDGSIGWDDAKNILWEGGKGAVLGSGFAKIGQKVGDWWGGRQAKAAQPYKTNDELEAAAQAEMTKDPASQVAQDLWNRSARAAEAEAAQGTSRGNFAKMLSGMEGATPAEEAALKKIGSGSGLTTKAGKAAGWAEGPAATAAMLNFAQNPSWMNAGIAASAGGFELLRRAGKSDWANMVPKKELEKYAALLRDPNGRGINADPETVRMVSDLFAKMGIGTAKSPVTPTVPEVGEAAKNAIRGSF